MNKNEIIEKPGIDVKYVAQLARLELDSSSLDKFQKDMENIVEYVDLLSELELDGIEPTAHPVASNNAWREDIVEESFPHEVMLKNAPVVLDDELIRVPQVITVEG
jgi:aspartyl-tRNA(Asn)/glutamyl-tRNA(Gln) amidotransferase subunit C